MNLDLTVSAEAEPLVLPGRMRLDERERRAAVADWRGRMVSEHVSARVFAGLLPQMMRAGVGPDLQAEVAEMIAEELRHARLCARVVSALGGTPIAPLPPLPEVPAHEDAPPVEAFLRNLISISCLHETVAVAVIEASRHAIVDEALHGVVTAILKDEVGHARLGWRLLGEEADRLDARARERMSEYLVTAFAQLRARNQLDVAHRVSDQAAELGVCDGYDATALFFHTVEAVIVPGLEEHGLSAQAAWPRLVGDVGASQPVAAAQVPATQVSAVGHTLPQPPQLSGSVLTLLHTPLHSIWPAAHELAAPHTPLLHERLQQSVPVPQP
jgi:hypothetical protein